MPIRESVSREWNAGYRRKTLVLRRRLLCFEAVIVSIAELELFEPAGCHPLARTTQARQLKRSRLRSKATASATPKSYACNRRSTLSKQTPGSAYSRLIRTINIAYKP